VLLVACSSHAPTVSPPSAGSGVAVADAGIADAPPVSQEQTLAAIQHAMNELDEGVQGCWAASAASERFDIEGTFKLHVDIGDADGGGKQPTLAHFAEDNVHNAGFTSCVVALAMRYHWAPPLYTQSIELPFKVSHPVDGQNVIDRRLVPWKGQGKVSVAVLLDENTSGNDAASIFELAVQSGGTTGMRTAEREEVWYFLGPATVTNVGMPGPFKVAAGDMAYVRKGGAREIKATAGDVHAVVFMLPGGREGTGRAGALPTPELTSWRSAPVGANVYPAATAKTFGPATIYMEPTITGSSTFSAEVLALDAGKEVAEHVHAKETELLYVLEGSGVMTVAGTDLAVGPTSVVQIPPATKHAFKATANFRAVQVYTPAGPEQRFKK
jgi:quercetin dioxygenase-like cupin family protein